MSTGVGLIVGARQNTHKATPLRLMYNFAPSDVDVLARSILLDHSRDYTLVQVPGVQIASGFLLFYLTETEPSREIDVRFGQHYFSFRVANFACFEGFNRKLFFNNKP